MDYMDTPWLHFGYTMATNIDGFRPLRQDFLQPLRPSLPAVERAASSGHSRGSITAGKIPKLISNCN